MTDEIEEVFFKETDWFRDALTEIERHVEAIMITTYGALGRRYPEYAHVLDDLLVSSDKIWWDRDAPAPRKIRFEIQVKRSTTADLGFNNQTREAFEEMMGERKSWAKKVRHGRKIAEALAA